MATSSRCAAVSDASEAAWTHAADLDDLWEGEMRAVSLGAVHLVMCNVEGQVFAYADRCPHLASRLSDGHFDGRLITCAAHEWVFDARGGCGVNPAESHLQRYPARVVDESIFVDLGETTR
jgi:toluene monooxygenase system ferredoxin subunit